jgi:hypothetical protein
MEDHSAPLTPKQLLADEMVKDRRHLQREMAVYIRMRDNFSEHREIFTGLIQDILTILEIYKEFIRGNH